MKRSRKLLVVGIVAGLCILALSRVGTEAAQVDKNARRIPARALALPKMPVTLDQVTATGVGKEIVLTYSVTNKTGGLLNSLEVTFFIVDPSGHIKGGGGWERDSDIAANSTEEFPVILQNKVDPADRLVVAAAKATGQAGTFEVEAAELVDAVKAQIAGRDGSSPSVRYTKVSAQDASFCQNAENRATAACKCGIQSFSCNETQKTYSYACFPKTNCVQGDR